MMKEIFYATGNSGKFSDVNKYVQESKSDIIIKQFEADIPEIQSLDLKAVAINKAEQAYEILKKPVIVDDSGLFVNKYNNFPGVMSKYVFEGIGFKGLMKLFDEGDKAEFIVSLVFAYGPGKFEIFERRISGHIVHPTEKTPFNPKLPYISIFVPDGYQKTLAELRQFESSPEFNPRVTAFRDFLAWLKNHEK